MRRLPRDGWLAVVGMLGLTAPAAAQYPGAYNPYPVPNYAPNVRPTVSPYLNIFNRGNTAGVNYYNFVRPITQANQQALMAPQNTPIQLPPGDETLLDPTDPGATIPRPAGAFAAGFMNYGGYFNSLGTIGAAPGQRGQARPQAGGPRRR